ncbi:MAG TPA: thiamine pyrophosphate-binding protein [Bryobacteraceae bacterium]|jgi:acetolactate synthase-1/2/3 large subunit|nr:thiamine pyrophosphate-binding protein [Bryobacteraceae bacterium]
MATNADRIVEMLKAAGVERLFGMPGGGSNADLIEAAGNAGLPFSLAHTETASAFMACAQAEITGKPGACLATLGPGAASLMNGIAHAHLDRVPLFVLTDCLGEPAAQVMRHQALRHGEMFSSVVKWSARPQPGEIDETLERALEEMASLPRGPVHLDLSSEVTSSPSLRGASTRGWRRAAGLDDDAIAPDFRQLLRECRRPVFLVGLGTRTQPIASAIRDICERLGIPALVTYKAKGVVPDRHPWFGGVFTNAALECNVLDRADLFVAVGLDPVELLPRPWTFRQPVISISSWPIEASQMPVVLKLVGDMVSLVHTLAGCLTRSEWGGCELLQLVADQRERMRPGLQEPSATSSELLPHRVVELVAEAYPDARASVDAGAHMFPVMTLWPVQEPSGLLISNGLATMGFAVPAAIGAALLDRSKPIVVFTGDGGLLMCSGELRTAARENLRLRIIVFQDDELSLIKIKQEQRGYRTDGVSIGKIDWGLVASGFGVRTQNAINEGHLRSCLQQTAECPGPVLIAAKISAGTYAATMRALRG